MKKEDYDLIQNNLELYQDVIFFRHYYFYVCKDPNYPWGEYEYYADKYDDWNFDYAKTNYDRARQIRHRLIHMTDSDFIVYKRLLKIANARMQKKYRLNRLLKNWIKKGYSCYFCTLNFNDDALLLDPKTRRRYITKYLSGTCVDFFANIDFGENNGREHYHAVAVIDDDKMTKGFIDNKDHRLHKSFIDYDLGFTDCILINTSDNNVYRITGYIDKLVNHALKSSVDQTKNIIRPRKKYKNDVKNI